MRSGRYQNVLMAQCHDVFVLGAGFSRAISDAMPLMRDLGSRVADELEKYRSVAPLFDGDIELAMTFLAQAHPWLAESERLRNCSRIWSWAVCS